MAITEAETIDNAMRVLQRLYRERNHYRDALVSIALTDYRGPEPRAVTAARVALMQINRNWKETL